MAKFETSLQDFSNSWGVRFDIFWCPLLLIVSRNCGQKPLWIKCIWCWGMEVFSPHIVQRVVLKGLLSRLGLTWKVTWGRQKEITRRAIKVALPSSFLSYKPLMMYICTALAQVAEIGRRTVFRAKAFIMGRAGSNPVLGTIPGCVNGRGFLYKIAHAET